MARVELSYQERIKELEQEKHDLKERLWEVTIAMINLIMSNITMIMMNADTFDQHNHDQHCHDQHCHDQPNY